MYTPQGGAIEGNAADDALLVIRGLGPDSWYVRFTLWTAAADYPVFSDIKTESIDQELTTPMTVGLFSFVPRYIAGIHIF
jgi:hypothetical protein